MRNVIHIAFDEFGSTAGGHKKAGSWYLTGLEAVAVVNLQKSNYGASYYINLGIWFLGIGPSHDPKPAHCHVQTRAELILDEVGGERLGVLLDLDIDMPEEERRSGLLAELTDGLLPLITAASSRDGLMTPPGRLLLAKSLIDSDGQHYLASIGVRY